MSHPAYRTYATTVARIQALSPNFTRITLSGDQLEHFATDGLDQRIKLIIPLADGTITDVGQFDENDYTSAWYRRWRELPDDRRNPIRTYTVRAPRPAAREIDVDFVLHGTEGPASAWATKATVGDAVQVVGPDARAPERGGLEWKPGAARTVLIVGDETAAPAICSIVESLDADMRGEVFIEVPSASDALPLSAPSGVQVTWLGRDGAAHGALLTEAVRAWGARRSASTSSATQQGWAPELVEGPRDEGPSDDDMLWEVPEQASGGEYAWLAGEAATITGLRRHLVRDLGIDRRAVAFMGYWRTGRAES